MFETRRETPFTDRLWSLQNKNFVLPTKPYPLRTQATKSQGKTEAMTQRALNETMLTLRKKRKNEKKNLTVSHTQHKAPLILVPISTIGEEWGHETKGAHIGSKKRNKKNSH